MEVTVRLDKPLESQVASPLRGPAPLLKGMSAVSSGLVAAPVSAIMPLPCAPDCQNSFFPLFSFRESLDKLSQSSVKKATVLGKKAACVPSSSRAIRIYSGMTKEKLRELPGGPAVPSRPWRRRCRACVVLGEGHAGQTGQCRGHRGSKDFWRRGYIQVQVRGAQPELSEDCWIRLTVYLGCPWWLRW